MHTDNLIVNHSCAGETVEDTTERLPDFNTVTATAFVIKSVDAVDTRCFMVTSKNEEIFWVLDFICKEKANNLNGLLSSINIVSKEEVVGLKSPLKKVSFISK